VFGDTSEYVSEVNCSRFLFVFNRIQTITQNNLSGMKKTILLFILMLLPIMSWADDSGECGNGVTYKYVESTHILTISKTGVGTGDMSNYSDMHPAPWINYGADIIKVIIEAGVNSIGSWAFECCKSLTAVTISEGVTTIGDDAFLFCI
jgi:hypothetical protein